VGGYAGESGEGSFWFSGTRALVSGSVFEKSCHIEVEQEEKDKEKEIDRKRKLLHPTRFSLSFQIVAVQSDIPEAGTVKRLSSSTTHTTQ
jgi:hypothetical protein